MSQSSEAETLALPPQEPVELDAAGLVDTYAEHLMDNLFEDVDRLLEGEEVLPTSSQLATVDTEAGMDTLAATDYALATTLPPLEVPQAAANAEPTQKRRWFRPSLEHWLIFGAVCSAVGLGALWAISQQRLNQANPAVVDGSPAASQSNAEFLNYLQRSLEVIGNKTPAASNDVATATLPSVATLPGTPLVVPPAPVGMAAMQGTRAPINVIERVYIPYQAASPATGNAPTTGARPSGVPLAQTPTAAASTEQHTLVGVLELGARSAALFEVDGVPQRIYIGERIGSSGWSLVSVSNEQAVIRRNGEVRSIYIGQKF